MRAVGEIGARRAFHGAVECATLSGAVSCAAIREDFRQPRTVHAKGLR